MKRKATLKTHFLSTKFLVLITSYLLEFFVQLLYFSLSIRVEISKELQEYLDSEKPLLVAFWHDSLIMMSWLLRYFPSRKFGIFISNSRDGHIPNKYAERLPNVECIRVTASFRHTTLKKAVTAMANGTTMVLTPDGPRGPRHVVKPGIAFLQKEAHATIIAIEWKASSFWELKSWDRFRIPKPFSKVVIKIVKAVDSDSKEDVAIELQNKLNSL